MIAHRMPYFSVLGILKYVIHIWKAMTLSYNFAYQEIISVHPTERQIFAGKPYSTFWNI